MCQTRKRPRSGHRLFCDFWRWCHQAFESDKNAESGMNARNTRKPPPKFTIVNEEVVYRSMTPQSPAIVRF